LTCAILPLVAACHSNALSSDAGGATDARDAAADVQAADVLAEVTAADGAADAALDVAVDVTRGDLGDEDGGFGCGKARCAPAQYCVARRGGPRLRCYDRPEGGPCPPDTTEGCDDVAQAMGRGPLCQEVRSLGDCLDRAPSCGMKSPCDCFCEGAICSTTERLVTCDYP
jgi:hypothetical protein